MVIPDLSVIILFHPVGWDYPLICHHPFVILSEVRRSRTKSKDPDV